MITAHYIIEVEFYAARKLYNTRSICNPVLKPEFDVWKSKQEKNSPLTEIAKFLPMSLENGLWMMNGREYNFINGTLVRYVPFVIYERLFPAFRYFLRMYDF